MDCNPFVVSALIDGSYFAETLVDTRCLSYGLCDPSFAQKNALIRLRIDPWTVSGFDGYVTAEINEVVIIHLDLDSYKEGRVFLYVVLIGHYNMILGMLWITAQDVRINSPRSELRIGGLAGVLVRSKNEFLRVEQSLPKAVMVSATSVQWLRTRGRTKKQQVEVFAASIADINKALSVKQVTDPQTKLPDQAMKHLAVFDQKKAEALPLLRSTGTDYSIELERDADKKEKEVLQGLLYSMSRDELLVLRKTLTDLLDKGFICISSSLAAAPVLFVRKPEGELRFCVDYRGLNRVTKKDCYLLLLIYETLRNISKARQFTKLDIIAAFYKLRIAEGDEQKTAFRTCYGLFEQLVTPFGLANAPSTFQKYINYTLRDYLDEFCSAYVDDILIYSSRSKKQHREHVCKVLQRLQDASLQVDIDKCEFEVQSTKYLGFIIEAGKGLQIDPAKVKAIEDWESLSSVKGVQGFLGFANFYRRFIQGYSDLVRLLTDLTHKDKRFEQSVEADKAFCKLKTIFVTALALAQFDYDKETQIETDSSGQYISRTL